MGKRPQIPNNLLNLVKNSTKEIKRNHVLAKIRLIEKKINWSAKFKSDMTDYFYGIESWPTDALEILLSKEFGYSDRIGLACFLHGNGLKDKDKALTIFQFYNKHWTWDRQWKIKFEKFQVLF